MFNKISTSYNLVKLSFKYIFKDGELFVYSLLSLFASFLILASFVGIDHFYFGFLDEMLSEDGTLNYLAILYTFIYYLVFSFITFFFNTAIITSVNRINNGQDNKLGDGLKDAISHFKEIFIWSLINATVTTIIKLLQSKFKENSIIGSMIVGLIGGMWNILTFFSFPLMVLNNIGPKDAIKKSGELFKKTWGERAILSVGVGFMYFFMFTLLIILAGFIIFSGMYIFGIIFFIIGIFMIIVLSNTSDVIIKTILLHLATTGELPNGLENEVYLKNIVREL